MLRNLTVTLLLTLLMGPVCHAREWHVSPAGDNGNSGDASAPLKTIQAAADRAMPGDTIVIHDGLYRERVDPPRGGTSDTARIVYQAAPGAHPEIRGSEIVKGWERVAGDVWKVTLPAAFFGDFNPFADEIRGDWFDGRGRKHHTGAVYLNGEWLIEAAAREDLFLPPGQKPAWLTLSDDYLLNVAWWRPGKDTSAPTISVDHIIDRKGTRNAPCDEGGECVGFIRANDWILFDEVDLGQNLDVLTLRVASATRGGIIEIRRDGPEGEKLGACRVNNTSGWQNWQSRVVQITPLSGKQRLCFVFRAQEVSRRELEAPLWFAEVTPDATTIWAQFPGVDPNTETVEINVRKAVFYPSRVGINYLTIRGLTMRHAAPNWAPPTAEQVALIGTNWSRGWVIEDNVISHSVCSGISLGKHGDAFDNTSENTAEGYVATIHRAIDRGWNRDHIGSHIVRRNHISHCEQTGIVGSLGAVFSVIEQNHIHDIHVRELFTGAEMAGIKLHGAIDVIIRNNYIHDTCRGLWLDWMAQGARVTGNVFDDNRYEDLFLEVNHGPALVDHNVFLSPTSLLTVSRGIAYAHNLFTGRMNIARYDSRLTPYHKAHSTELAGMHDNICGDDRYYNNLFIGPADLTPYDHESCLPVFMGGNVFLNGARPSRREADPLVLDDEQVPVPETDVSPDGTVRLRITFPPACLAPGNRSLVTTDLLGKASIPSLPYEQPDGTPYRLDYDMTGRIRQGDHPIPGPFQPDAPGAQSFTMWQPPVPR
ncbi:MAG TPA: carbohydrate-binding protein [Candidatus Hydrogenedentes bacterium]|nr:carbohydrate-binding protein [Candidatus Hydrogenedentota bacterium]